MTIEHSQATDPEIHEPKGISTASNGQIYTANGLGSGVWGLPLHPSNEVIVEQESDFGIASGGIITLTPNTAYKVSGTVTCTNRLVVGADIVIFSQGEQITTLIYTGVDDFITLTNAGIEIYRIAISCPNQPAGKFVINAVSTTPLDSVNLTNISVPSCGGFVKAEGIAVVLSTSNCLEYRGNCLEMIGVGGIVLSISKFFATSTVASSTTIDFGTSILPNIEIVDLILQGVGKGISGLTSSGNVTAGELAVVQNSSFSGIATPLVGITTIDDQWGFTGNTGVENTKSDGQGSILGSALSTTFSGTGVGNEVLVNFGAAFIPDREDKVTISTAGRFTYTGVDPKEFYASAEIFAIVSGGATREYVFQFAKNGTIITSSQTKGSYDGSNPGTLSVSTDVHLEQNDYLELCIYAVTATTSINIDTASIKIIGFQ